MLFVSSGFGSRTFTYPSKGKLGTVVIFLLGYFGNEDPPFNGYFLLAYCICTVNEVIASYPRVTCLVMTGQGIESLFIIRNYDLQGASTEHCLYSKYL